MASSSPADAQGDAPSPSAPNTVPSADAAADSPLFKLAPELRNRIHRHLFGSSEAIKPVVRVARRRKWCYQRHVHNPDDDYDVLWDDENDPIKNFVHTSIFSVCHSIKADAMDVLYGTKILRGNALDMDIALDNKDVFDLVRYVEIKDCVYAYRQPGEARRLRAVLNESRCPTGLRSMIVLSDELSSSYAPISIMDFVADAGLGPATCVDVGRYQLEGAFKGVQIVNRQLQELWPDVRATLEDHDGLEDALAIIESLDSSEHAHNIPTWASHTSLRCWVDIQQEFIEMRNSGDWQELLHKASTGTYEEHTDDESTYVFLEHTIASAMRSPVIGHPLLRTGEHVLSKLKPGDDRELLDQASEFLAVNIANYNRVGAHPTVDAEWHLCTVVWGPTWAGTGKTALEHMVEQQNIALSGSVSTEFVWDPVIQHEIPARNLIDHKLASKWTSRLPGTYIHGSLRNPDDPGALRQLSHLHLAISHCDWRFSSGYHHRREQWAKNLLHRYLLASGRLDESDVAAVVRANTDDLRTIVSTVLDVFQHHLGRIQGGDEFVESFFRDIDVPATFDSDVWPQLGWNYGLLSAKAVKRYGSQGSLSKTLARQWVKEGTMWQ